MVFIIDDCSDDRALVLHELKAEFPDVPVQEISDAEELEAAFGTLSPSLVVTDLTLGWTTGFDVLAQAKSLFPNCPVIMYTGTGDEEAAVEGLKAGLDDYVVKDPRRLQRLRSALRKALEAN